MSHFLYQIVYKLRNKYNVIDFVILLAVTYWVVATYPMDLILANTPATGGDTGSHFWPLKLLIDQGPLSGNVRIWNPGNLLGEPILTHYFPLPFYIMYFLSFIMPEHIAFNLGTAIPCILFPVTIYYSVRSMSCRFPIPVIATVGSLFLLYNGAYNAWGGNMRSVLAGQFCHQYALIFLMLFLARLRKEIAENRTHTGSILLAAATCLSHAYVAISLPIATLALVLPLSKLTTSQKIRTIAFVGLGAGLLSLWWLWPMLDNNKWATAYADDWLRNLKFSEYLPWRLLVILILALTFFPVINSFSSRLRWQFKENSVLLLFTLMAVFYLLMVYLFPKVGLVDIRALPQVYMFVILALAVNLGYFLRTTVPVPVQVLAVLVILGMTFKLTKEERAAVTHWTNWNYSGWDKKNLYPAVQGISKRLRGDYDDPRVVYEHDPAMNGAGTTRVFEMSPYFMGRSTMESLYLQATLMARPVYLLQALVSDKASCPIPGNPCPRPDLARARKYLDLLVVSDLILSSELTINQAKEQDYLEENGRFGIWTLFHNKDKLTYVEPIDRLSLSSRVNWRSEFMEWLDRYNTGDTINIADMNLPETMRSRLLKGKSDWDIKNCHAETAITYNQIELKTNCPHRPHLLKFSYHDSWRSDNDSPMYLASPGMIVTMPQTEKTTFRFGQKMSWKLSLYLSGIFFVGLFGCRFFRPKWLRMIIYTR